MISVVFYSWQNYGRNDLIFRYCTICNAIGKYSKKVQNTERIKRRRILCMKCMIWIKHKKNITIIQEEKTFFK